MPSVDLLGGIDTILDKVKGSGYSGQFELDLEISNLIKSAHDSHLVFQLCSQSVFNYVIDLPLVSVSTDGLSLPEIYTLSTCMPALFHRTPSNQILQTTQSSNRIVQRTSPLWYLSMARMQRSISSHLHLARLSKTAMRSMFPITRRSSLAALH